MTPPASARVVVVGPLPFLVVFFPSLNCILGVGILLGRAPGAIEFFVAGDTACVFATFLPNGHLFDNDLLQEAGIQDIVHVILFGVVVLGR